MDPSLSRMSCFGEGRHLDLLAAFVKVAVASASLEPLRDAGAAAGSAGGAP